MKFMGRKLDGEYRTVTAADIETAFWNAVSWNRTMLKFGPKAIDELSQRIDALQLPLEDGSGEVVAWVPIDPRAEESVRRTLARNRLMRLGRDFSDPANGESSGTPHHPPA